MNIEPADVDRIIQTVSEGIAGAIIRLAEHVYRWHRNRSAPYYVPPSREQEAIPEPAPKDEPYSGHDE